MIQWGSSSSIQTFGDTLNLDGHQSWLPSLIDEDNEHIVLRGGCGSPCLVGYFLALDSKFDSFAINEYLGYNLADDIVVSVQDTSLQIFNLKSKKSEYFSVSCCNSAFIGYCIDSLTIQNNTLRFKWIPETYINSNEGIFIEKRIDLQ